MDNIPNNVAWVPFSNRLISEWGDFVIAVSITRSLLAYGASYLYFHKSTVILNANVAFLAIPYVGLTAEAEFPQILSYISTIASVGSITIGLFLVRQIRKSSTRSTIPEGFVSLFVTRLCHPLYAACSVANI